MNTSSSTNSITVTDGILTPGSIDDALKLGELMVKSGMLPKHIDSVPKYIAASQFALELGVKPLTALRQIAVIHGTPSVWGDLPLALCYARNLVEWMEEYYFDKEGKKISAENNNLTSQIFGAYAKTKRRNDTVIAESWFTLDEARQADLANNPTWKKYTKRMLRYRARSQVLKDKYPDALNGIAIAEYDFNTTADDTGTIIDVPAEINSGAQHQAEQKKQVEKEFRKKEETVITSFYLRAEKYRPTILKSLGVSDISKINEATADKISTTYKLVASVGAMGGTAIVEGKDLTNGKSATNKMQTVDGTTTTATGAATTAATLTQ